LSEQGYKIQCTVFYQILVYQNTKVLRYRMADYTNYNYLGFHNPYYNITQTNQIDSFHNFLDFVSKGDRVLDFSAFTEVSIYGYCLGDRTLIKNLKKSPWMARPNLENTGWDYERKIKHSEL